MENPVVTMVADKTGLTFLFGKYSKEEALKLCSLEHAWLDFNSPIVTLVTEENSMSQLLGHMVAIAGLPSEDRQLVLHFMHHISMMSGWSINLDRLEALTGRKVDEEELKSEPLVSKVGRVKTIKRSQSGQSFTSTRVCILSLGVRIIL